MEKGILAKWLKSGFVEKRTLYPTRQGTPQGGLCKALHKPPYAKKNIMQSNLCQSPRCQALNSIYFA
jgi:hypothetical protein